MNESENARKTIVWELGRVLNLIRLGDSSSVTRTRGINFMKWLNR
jgi:hypothetical protein